MAPLRTQDPLRVRHRCRHTKAIHPPLDPARPIRIAVQGDLSRVEKLFSRQSMANVGSVPNSVCASAGARTSTCSVAFYGKRICALRNRVLQAMTLHMTAWSATSDQYGVTFDHRVADDDPDPEVVQFNLFDPTELSSPVVTRNGRTITAPDGRLIPTERDLLQVSLNEEEYQNCIAAVPRCCQIRRGTTDRARVNSLVKQRQARTE
ncbi:MAG: hypothetical protein M1816_000351 [Peltula sp. TS41687]|nr:MAG: hypothetical protein M1816_000351 [Peltula sp. TS41687]